MLKFFFRFSSRGRPTAKSWGPDSHETHTRPAPSARNHRAALRRRSSPPTMMVRDSFTPLPSLRPALSPTTPSPRLSFLCAAAPTPESRCPPTLARRPDHTISPATFSLPSAPAAGAGSSAPPRHVETSSHHDTRGARMQRAQRSARDSSFLPPTGSSSPSSRTTRSLTPRHLSSTNRATPNPRKPS